MSAPLDKIGNRFREMQGQPFTKIPQTLINAEQRLELIKSELAAAKSEKQDTNTIQRLEARMITTMRLIAEIKSNLRKS